MKRKVKPNIQKNRKKNSNKNIEYILDLIKDINIDKNKKSEDNFLGNFNLDKNLRNPEDNNISFHNNDTVQDETKNFNYLSEKQNQPNQHDIQVFQIENIL
jgi:hypothetical protein